MTEMASESERAEPADDGPARRRIVESLDESLIVEAAAGTGKTTVLVKRLVAVLASGRATVDKVVAVTFTRKAAGELKLRLREALDRARSESQDDGERRRLEAALARLEEARIGTIHGFCAELLRERPVEAAIDPAFREADDEEARSLYDRAFRRWMEDRLADPPPGLRRALSRLALSPGLDGASPIERLRDAGWSLVEWRDFPAPWRRKEDWDRDAAMAELVARVERLAELARRGRPDDYLRRALEPVVDLELWRRGVGEVASVDPDEVEARLVDLRRLLRRNPGWKGRSRQFAPGLLREVVQGEREALGQALDAFRDEADADLAALLRRELAGATAAYEEAKRRSGRLDFLDLLVRARDLVRDRADVRRGFQERFSHLFVDELQDTDPLQAEILLLLSSDDPAVSDWRAARPVPGKLFLVGDPKQSIYRFRRADVLLYRRIRERLTEAGVALVHLNRSYRAVEPLQQAVNAAFRREMQSDGVVGQPDYVPLAPFRRGPGGQPTLVALPVPYPYGWNALTAQAIEAGQPALVAAWLDWLLRESGWTVEDPETGERVAVAPRHVALLFRRFVSWGDDVSRAYTRELDARAIPHLLVGGRSFYQREEVETLRAALVAIEHPDDELAVYATLKGSLFAIDDGLLLRWRNALGAFHPFVRRPGDEESETAFLPIVEALNLLRDLHRERNRRPFVETVQRLLAATRAHAGFALRPAGQQVLANVQRIVELARSYEQRGGLSFRGFVERLGEEAERPGAAVQAVVEEGVDGVRLLTVHTAKGLEFPVVVLADVTAALAREEPDRFLDPDSGLAATRVLGCSPWELLDHARLEADRDRAEGVRLAYVAATRARDLLAVPVVGDGRWSEGWVSPLVPALYPLPAMARKPRPAPGCPPFGDRSVLGRPASLEGGEEASVAPGLHRPELGEHEVVWWDPAVLALDAPGRHGLREEQLLADTGDGAAQAGLDRWEAWQDRRAAVTARGSAPRQVVVTVSETEDDPPSSDLDLAVEALPRPAQRPTGRRFGTLVHTLLRDAPFAASDAELRALAVLHARVAEAPPAEIDAAVAAVRATLHHPLLRRAAAAPAVHREAPFVLARPDGTLVEGTIDLAFAEGDGAEATWVVVDFKTDADSNDLLKRYRRQLGWYVWALRELTGRPARGVLLGV